MRVYTNKEILEKNKKREKQEQFMMENVEKITFYDGFLS